MCLFRSFRLSSLVLSVKTNPVMLILLQTMCVCISFVSFNNYFTGYNFVQSKSLLSTPPNRVRPTLAHLSKSPATMRAPHLCPARQTDERPNRAPHRPHKSMHRRNARVRRATLAEHATMVCVLLRCQQQRTEHAADPKHCPVRNDRQSDSRATAIRAVHNGTDSAECSVHR